MWGSWTPWDCIFSWWRGGEDVVKGEHNVFPNQFRDIWYHTTACKDICEPCLLNWIKLNIKHNLNIHAGCPKWWYTKGPLRKTYVQFLVIFKLMFVGSILYGRLAIPLFWIGSKYLATTAPKWMQVEFTSTPGDDSIEPRKFDPQERWDWKDCICLRTFWLTFMVNRSKLHGSYWIPSVVITFKEFTYLYVPCVSFQYPSGRINPAYVKMIP